jgi:uroporphyrinogen decarboxylase
VTTSPAATRAAPPSAFLRACRGEDGREGEPDGHVPVWFMRQAGRSLPEYFALRGEGTILDAIARPDVATEITLQPVRRYGVDAAILFSDIVVPIAAIGFGVDIVPGTGPVIDQPFRSTADLQRIRPLEPDVDTPYVLETVANLVDVLDVPLIGFAGAPFTVASYLIEGRPSRNYALTKAMMHAEPALWHALLDRLADLAVASVRSQIGAGAQAMQLFDSWVGDLSEADYLEFVAPHTTRIFAQLADLDVPRIHFGVNTGELLAAICGTGPDVIGVDWRLPLDVAAARLPRRTAVQGNLDPTICLAPWPVVEAQVRRVLREGARADGPHIFNLGHGVLPETDPTVLERVVELVHAGPDPEAARSGGPG